MIDPKRTRGNQAAEEDRGEQVAVEQEGLETISAAAAGDVLAVSNQARSNFISMLSHELRTPLHALNGFLSIVLSEQVGELNERQREFLGYAQDSTEQLILLAQDIILLSKADLRQLGIECASLPLSEVIAKVFRSVGPAASKAGVALQSQVSLRLPSLWGDATLLQQVLLNLIHNALKCTPSGGSITIHARRAGDMAKISVEDTGCGVPREDQSALFGQIYQSEDALLAKHGGFGLGLSVARVIVEHHGGRIWVQSEPGNGSTISFTIPLFPPQQPGPSGTVTQ